MGSKKIRIAEGIREGDQRGREAIEAGEQLEGDGSEIKSLLDGIDTSMDEDDVEAVRSAESGYDSDFKSAFKAEVDTKADEMKNIETKAINESEGELAKVSDAAGKFHDMSAITDVGRSNAEGAADRMRNSASEYEEYMDEAYKIIEDAQRDVDALRASIESIFG